METLKTAIYTLIAILGNPFAILLSYLLAFGLFDAKTTISTNVTQINVYILLGILVLIFCLRLWLYQLITLKKIDFLLKNKSFFEGFTKAHLIQVIGLLNLYLYVIPVEGNIMGFFNIPISLLSILVVNIIVVIKLIQFVRNF